MANRAVIVIDFVEEDSDVSMVELLERVRQTFGHIPTARAHWAVRSTARDVLAVLNIPGEVDSAR